jgi:hypothetical protein
MVIKKQDDKDQSKTSRPGNIYDVYVKSIFSQVWLFIEFLDSFMDYELFSCIDVSNVTLAPTHYVNLGGIERILDLVFFCPFKDRTDVKIVIIFEHASSNIEKLPVRLLHYASTIWLDESNKGAKILSAIYFIVLRTGKKPYGKPQPQIEDYLPKYANGEIIGFNPMIRYILIDLSEIDEEQLSDKPVLQATLGVLKRVTEGQEEEFKKAMFPLKGVENENRRKLVENIILNFAHKIHIARGKEFTDEDVFEALEPIEGERTEKMVRDIFGELETKGKAIGLQDTVLRRVHKKFTNAPKRIETTIRQISDISKLDSLIDYIFESRTLDEFEAALK